MTKTKPNYSKLPILIVLLLCLVNCSPEPEGSIIKSDGGGEEEVIKFPGDDGINFIFKKGMEGYSCYRIPALLRVDENILLAFAEGRKLNCSDTGDIDLVVKRSQDNGFSWSENIVIWSDGSNTCGNPAPVLNAKTGEVVLLATWNNGEDDIGPINDGTSIDTRRVYKINSVDKGLTWNTPTEITTSVKESNWRWYATGPGSGIQIKNGTFKDRMVVGCDFIDENRRGYSHVIISDDDGTTWTLGGVSPESKTNECEVAELSDGKLMLNMRNTGPENRRKVAISEDGGATWNYKGVDNALVSPVVQASLHRFSFGDNKENILLFSNPADINERKRMTIRISNDDGETWVGSHSMHNGFAAYSDMENYSAERVAILYETGENLSDRYDGISFETVAIEDIY